MGNVRLGIEADVLKDCRIRLTDEIFKIEKPGEVTCDPSILQGENSPVKSKLMTFSCEIKVFGCTCNMKPLHYW